MTPKFDDRKRQEDVVKTYTPAIIKVVKLQSLLDAHIFYTGSETGKQYEWNRAGSIVVVDAADAPSLLEKRIKAQSCCNGSDNAIFQKVD